MAQAPKPEDSAKPSRQQLAPTGTLFREFTLPGGVHIILFQGMRLTEYNLDTSKGNRLHWSRGETGTVQLDEFSMPISESAAIFARDGERTNFAKHAAENTEVIVVNWPESTLFPKGRQIYTPSEAVFDVTQQLWETLMSGKTEQEIELVVEQLTRELQAELPYSDQFVTALDVLNTRLDDPFAPQILSDYLGLSDSQIRRLFHQLLGISPSQYHLRNRLNLARYLIQTSSQQLETTALKCGFASYPTFSSQFKREFGFAPKNARIR